MNKQEISNSKKEKKSAMIDVEPDVVTKPKKKEKRINDDVTVSALVEKYLPYATSITSKVMKTLSSDIDFDEILSSARLGLFEAARRYDEQYGVDFKTFAYYRIKGAIYDGLRKTGWLPRSLYSKIKFEKAANDYIESTTGSVQNFFQKELDNIKHSVNSVASIYVMSVDAIEDYEIEDQNARREIEHKAEFQKIKEKVCTAIEGLPDKERKLIKMYYFQNKTLQEIGQQLGLSKSWTSRLHARSLELLFKKMANLGQSVM